MNGISNTMNKHSQIYLDDSVVSIQQNTNLKHKPFLITIYTYDHLPYEIRFDQSDLSLLADFIHRTIGEKK
jgi:hypothetical protein